MTRCNACESVEPRTREMTEDERIALGLAEDETFDICAECGHIDEETLEHFSEDDPREDR